MDAILGLSSLNATASNGLARLSLIPNLGQECDVSSTSDRGRVSMFHALTIQDR